MFLVLANGNIGDGNKGPPYARIQRQQSRYIASKYLPKDFVLIEPRNLKLADGLAFLKHIHERQATNKAPNVFRFEKVATSRKADEAGKLRPAHYPDDSSDAPMSTDTSESKVKPKKPRKAKKVVPKEDRVARTLQKEMEGLLILAEPQVADAANATAQDTEPPLAVASQPDHPQYVITNGPNDPIPPGPGIFAIPANAVVGAQLQEVALPRREFTGVIDPALIGLRAEPPPQLITPRPSVTPNMSPVKQETFLEATITAANVVSTAVNKKAKAVSKRPQLPSIAEGSVGRAAQPTPREPIRPRARAKVRKTISPGASGLVTPTATTATTDRTNSVPATPSKAEGVRRTADALAAEEASRIATPAKRVRTPKVRTR